MSDVSKIANQKINSQRLPIEKMNTVAFGAPYCLHIDVWYHKKVLSDKKCHVLVNDHVIVTREVLEAFLHMMTLFVVSIPSDH